MRDRLIELFEAIEKDPAITCPHYKTDKTCDTCKYTINNVMCNHTLRTVDYLLANGVVVPPCKVGDILFCIFSDKSIDKTYTHIEACRVNEIMFFGSDSFVFGVREINRHYNHNAVLGKNAFKTFEEAEAKWKKEREGK